MYAADAPDTFWLVFVNIALGLGTLALVVVTAAGIAYELRRRVSRGSPAIDDHALEDPRLGRVMADGGTRVDHD